MNKPLIIICILLSGIISPVSYAEQVSLLVEQAPPYTEKSRQDKGLVSALVVDAFKREGLKTSIEFASWAEVEKKVDNDRYVSFMWERTKPRLKKWLFSNPVYIQQNKFAVLAKNKLQVTQLHQLRGLKVGVTSGFSYGQMFDDFVPKLQVTQLSSEYQTVSQLLNEQVALVAIDPTVAVDLVNKYFKQTKPSTIKFLEASYLSQTQYYLVCSKRYGNCVNLIKKFNQGLAKINSDGSRQRIFTSHIK